MLASSDGPSPGAPVSPGLPRLVLGALYRVLPGIAMVVAAGAIVVTLVQATGLRSHTQTVAAPVVTTAPSAAPRSQDTAVPSPSVEPRQGAPAAAAVAEASGVVQSAAPSTPAATATPPSPTATPLPAVSVQVAPPSGGSVRIQGRILQPSDQLDYWFLIREPGREGFFRQGPAILSSDGSFSYLLSLTPLDTGPDSVTLAAVPRDLSLAWTRLALGTGAYLPVVDVRTDNGIRFLQEVRLQPVVKA